MPCGFAPTAQRRAAHERAVAVAAEDRDVSPPKLATARSRRPSPSRSAGHERARSVAGAESDRPGRRGRPCRCPRNTETLPEPSLATTTSGAPSPSKSPTDHGRGVVAGGQRGARGEPASAVAEEHLHPAGAGAPWATTTSALPSTFMSAVATARGAGHEPLAAPAREAAVDVAQDAQARVVRRDDGQVLASVLVEVGGGRRDRAVARQVGARRAGERRAGARRPGAVLHHDRLSREDSAVTRSSAAVGGEAADREAARAAPSGSVGRGRRRVK